jgi:hypothetical protein
MSCNYKLQNTNYTLQFECMSFPFSPYLSQMLMELLKFLIRLQRIKISIYVCNVREVIFKLSGMINFTIKDQLQLVWTGFFFFFFVLWTH